MRKHSLRLLIAFILCISFGALFSYIATSISNKSIAHFDNAVIAFVQGLEAPWLTVVMKGVTWIGSGFGVVLITLVVFVVLFFKFRFRKQAYFLLIVIAGTVLFNTILKHYFERERPTIHRIMDANGFSFPSGHSMMAFSLYVIIAYIAWRNVKTVASRVLLVLFAGFMIIMIGSSRIYVGVHYPSDVVGGIVASALWLTIAISVYAIYQGPREKKMGS
ncbi:phosphatase PAP2 family protein [Filibacter tadaridae]|uniref:phosphatase PAP2 family protein n=1 Tax=Filibacter tadaridae TaxID=2483811 RepID=UPI00135BF021|nr:phosphatase PAP2 family protein [Filibacter tadaridae]